MKIQVISKHLYIFYSIVFLLYIVNVFVESNQLSYLLGILAMMMLLISVFGASKLFKILGSTFFIIGGTLFYSTGQSLTILPTYFVSNIPLLALLAMLPWMNSAVRSGRFDRSLSELIKVNVSDLGKLYPRSSITTLPKCMTCGVCLEACPNVNDKNDFIGPAPLSQVRLFNAHPTGEMNKAERLETIMGDGGLADCGNSQNCVQSCPKGIPLTTSIAALNRDTAIQSFKNFFGSDKI